MHTRPRWLAPSSLRALALFGALFLATAARAGFLTADSTYMGYRIPEHRWTYWTASVNASGTHGAASLAGDRNTYDGNLFLSLGTGATWSYDSDRLQHQWGFNTNVAGGRQGQRVLERFSPVTFERDASIRDLLQSVRLSGSLRHYPWGPPIGFTLSGATSLSLLQSFTSENYSYRSPFDRSASTYGSSRGNRSYLGSIGAGFGFGRVRDVAPVYQAQVLESRLLRQQSLTQPLSDRARDQLAALFAVESDVFAAHERPGKFFWREIERILREDGALAEAGLDAYDVLRLLESTTLGKAGFLRRSAGFFIGPSIDVLTRRFHFTQEESYSNLYYVADTVVSSDEDFFKRTRNERRDDVFVSFGAELYRPLTPNWQLDAYSRVGIQEAGEYPSFTNSLAVTWIITDRWRGGVQAYQVATGQGRSRHFDKWRAELRGDLSYFLEDRWALTLTGFEGQSRDAVGLAKNGGFELRMTWIVSGLFEAPRLVEPMRPLPPEW